MIVLGVNVQRNRGSGNELSSRSPPSCYLLTTLNSRNPSRTPPQRRGLKSNTVDTVLCHACSVIQGIHIANILSEDEGFSWILRDALKRLSILRPFKLQATHERFPWKLRRCHLVQNDKAEHVEHCLRFLKFRQPDGHDDKSKRTHACNITNSCVQPGNKTAMFVRKVRYKWSEETRKV